MRPRLEHVIGAWALRYPANLRGTHLQIPADRCSRRNPGATRFLPVLNGSRVWCGAGNLVWLRQGRETATRTVLVSPIRGVWSTNRADPLPTRV